MSHLPLMLVQANQRRDMERSGWQLVCLPSHKFPRAASPELYLWDFPFRGHLPPIPWFLELWQGPPQRQEGPDQWHRECLYLDRHIQAKNWQGCIAEKLPSPHRVRVKTWLEKSKTFTCMSSHEAHTCNPRWKISGRMLGHIVGSRSA